MSLVINTNVASLNAQRSLTASGAELKTAMERLSSGKQINSAADDAAGFAIAERMTAQIRGLNMATKNANDGLSMLATIENATNDITGMLHRMRELAVQGINDTNGTQDRAYLQLEVDALMEEINRVASDTQYNGKRVRVVVELAARFDEQANIAWSERLTDAGIEVIFGIPGLKVHSKLFLIDRMENGELVRYSHVGTGNLNEKTARLYTDFTLLTADPEICEDVNEVFEFLKYNYRRPDYKHLLVSPHTSRGGIMRLIDEEIANARQGFRAQLFFKCNNLVDRQLTLKLYEASQAGVEVKLIVRGMCSLLPGVSGISANIKAISIIDRFLEHPRVYVAHNRGEPKYYIGSADLMTRNIDYRVEVICPVKDADAQRTLQDILDQQWNDNCKARVIDAYQSNNMVTSEGKATLVRSQETIHRYLETGKLPRMPKSSMRKPSIRRRRGKS